MQEKSMLIVRVNQRAEGGGVNQSFRLIPLNKSCSYIAGEFSIAENLLILLHADIKDELTSVPKINSSGQPEMKNGNYVIERRLLPEFFESRISDSESIVEFINTIAVNAENVSLYMPFLSQIQFKDPNKLEKQPLIVTNDAISSPHAQILTS